ncbi:hypothetical protein [Halomontanus rarus]|uniref:hypothetical protein n=1 Tax=Halomontanus rarus TaxID=3034020 RepID=UPI00293BC9C6|nr:hypothetical protein [Halovivax sp. KZCA124]
MQRRTLLSAVSSGAIMYSAGCLGGGEDGISEDAEVIEVHDDGFEPIRLEVEPGTTVGWEHHLSGGRDMELRSTTFDDAATEWELSERTDSFVEHTFEEEGVYHFYENIITKWAGCGAVIVGDVEQDEPLPCE